MKTASKAMERVMADLRPLAAAYRGDGPPGRSWRKVIACLRGESGVGKTHLARWLATESNADSFKALNIAALSETLIESELFGHERGAFTGASERKRGLVYSAGRGMLLLDEIGALPMSLQSKLLRLLGERKYLPVGATKEETAHCIFVVATCEDLEGKVARGEFREDLYHRITGYPVVVPPLRERPEDIDYFVGVFAEGASVEGEAVELLRDHKWGRGNLRELEKIIRRVILRDGALTVAGVAVALDHGDAGLPLELEEIPKLITAEDRERVALRLASVVGHVTNSMLATRVECSRQTAQRTLAALSGDGGPLVRVGKAAATRYVLASSRRASTARERREARRVKGGKHAA